MEEEKTKLRVFIAQAGAGSAWAAAEQFRKDERFEVVGVGKENDEGTIAALAWLSLPPDLVVTNILRDALCVSCEVRMRMGAAFCERVSKICPVIVVTAADPVWYDQVAPFVVTVISSLAPDFSAPRSVFWAYWAAVGDGRIKR